MADEHSYRYLATVVSVYDGDTITVDIDLGFHLTLRTPVRLARIDAPEMTGPEKVQGIVTMDYLRGLLVKGRTVLLQTFKDGKEKYGRSNATTGSPANFSVSFNSIASSYYGAQSLYLAEVWLDGENVSDRLLTLQLATLMKEF